MHVRDITLWQFSHISAMSNPADKIGWDLSAYMRDEDE